LAILPQRAPANGARVQNPAVVPAGADSITKRRSDKQRRRIGGGRPELQIIDSSHVQIDSGKQIRRKPTRQLR
jgi:hypothetical protein